MDQATAQTGPKILIYSHDSFGLGHLRRCREIAHALVESDPDLSVLILSGSPIIGSFEFRNRVDFVRIPGVIKLRNGEYSSLKLPLGIEQTIALRASIIKHTAEAYQPDLFLVDKEPLGLRGEVEPTLQMLSEAGVPCVLGLRDVMDDPDLLAPEWERKHVIPALARYYDDIWIYGLPQICNPMEGLGVQSSVLKRTSYTGYLRRAMPEHVPPLALEKISKPYILVTVGGGGDGESIVDWVLSTYEHYPDLPYPALIVLGPFMGGEAQYDFLERIDRLPNVEGITFSPHMESLLDQAVGVVGMGGYNTFCEILSFNKRALIIPRVEPRREQYIRASKAQELGLLSMVIDDGSHDLSHLATALRNLPQQSRPSEVVVPGLLDGRENLVRLAKRALGKERSDVEVARRRSSGS